VTGSSVARRYWRLLTGSRTVPESLVAGRGRVGYSFGQRYWASLVGVILPAVEDAKGARSRAHFSAPSQRVRTMPTADPGLGGWFLLPGLRVPAILQAGDESRVIAEAATPGGRAEFFVRRGGTSRRYVLEVVLRDFDDLPGVVFVRYGTAHGGRLLIVPLTEAEIGPPSAQVELAGIDVSKRWEVLGPLSADQAATWDADTVAASVSAAANEATREAWRWVSGSLGPELQRLIERTLP
jgi:hypothetical protein